MDFISILVGSIEAIAAVAVTSFGVSVFSNYFGRQKNATDSQNTDVLEDERGTEDAVDEEAKEEASCDDAENGTTESKNDTSDTEDQDERQDDEDSDSDKDSNGKRNGVFVAAVPVGGKDKDEDEENEEDEEEKSEDDMSEDDADKADDKDDEDSDSDKDSDGKRNGVFVAAVPVGGKDKDEDEEKEEKEENDEPHVPVIVDHINAIEADEMMSDELALALVIEEDEQDEQGEEMSSAPDADGVMMVADMDTQENEDVAPMVSGSAPATTSQPVHSKTEGQKGHINVGDVDAAFEPGNVVTLDALKQKGLVPKKIMRIKILADGELTKPLTVKAHSFSIQAIKMIELTGGTVIKLR